MQKQGKGRRNKRDPESRDFTCLCGKSYLSYAAAYTHAKNKHKGQKLYIDGIVKPQRQQLKRGRPKEKKVKTQSQQTSQLTLIQSAILKICELLEGAFHKTILEGNEQRDQTEFESHFKFLCEDYNKEEPPEFSSLSFEDEEFMKALIKDFSSDVAARVKFSALFLSSQPRSIDFGLSKLNYFCSLWKERRGVNEVIASALKQWRKMSQNGVDDRQNQQENEEDFDI